MTVRVETGPAPCPTCGHVHHPRKRYVRKIACEGNCGRWWYSSGPGRPRRWCDRCYPMHKRALAAGVVWPADPLGRSDLVPASEPLRREEGTEQPLGVDRET